MDDGKKKLIIIAGPTATGKSSLAVALSHCLGGEVVSADSVQAYRGMDIGSAKIKKDEMEGVPHHLIDILDIHESYNAMMFKERAGASLKGIYERGNIPIICGGTGFYIQALLYDIDFMEAPCADGAALRNSLENLYRKRGLSHMQELLKESDPYSYDAIDLSNVRKVIRALEFKKLYGISIREHNEKEAKKREAPPYDYKFFVLYGERRKMYEKINNRVDNMMEEGLLEEVKRLKEKGLNKNLTAGQAIGYKEMLDYIDGKSGLEEAKESIKLNTRHFAKRQLTWFRREKNTLWINIDDGDALNAVRKYL